MDKEFVLTVSLTKTDVRFADHMMAAMLVNSRCKGRLEINATGNSRI